MFLLEYDYSKDTFQILGALLSNLELLVDPLKSPWLLRGLLNRGLTCSAANIRSALIQWFKKASQQKEWDFVSTDLSICLLNAQKQADNTKCVVTGTDSISNFGVA